MNVEMQFFSSCGIEVVENDNVGYQRAKKFTEEIGLTWTQDWFIYGGKVYVKPNRSQDEIAGCSHHGVPKNNEVLSEVLKE